jgi:hypothetical protein
MDRADVGVVQLGGRPRLARESLKGLGIASQVFGKEFQRNMPSELEVFCLINNAHTPAPEFSEDAVMGYLLADHERA